MKLFYSQNSPYARVARIAVFEAGLKDSVEQIKVVNRSLDSPLLKYSPTCRVPTLVDGELVLGESRHICAYIDELTGRNQFFPNRHVDWSRVGFESAVIGFMDGIVAWVSESRRPREPVSDKRIESEHRKALRCLEYFESVIEKRAEWFQCWDFVGISLACAFSLMIFHNFLPGWGSKFIRLQAWMSDQEQRPSMIETAPKQPSDELLSNERR